MTRKVQAWSKLKTDHHLTDNLYVKECSKVITEVITEGDYRTVRS